MRQSPIFLISQYFCYDRGTKKLLTLLSKDLQLLAGMIFVLCKNGIIYNEDWNATPENLAA